MRVALTIATAPVGQPRASIPAAPTAAWSPPGKPSCNVIPTASARCQYTATAHASQCIDQQLLSQISGRRQKGR